MMALAEDPITRLACGSCYKPAKDLGLWEKIGATKPQLFLFMGDNIYADTEDMALMRARYDELHKHPGYLAFRKQCPILPIWDDHDYGANDAGADYPKRQLSQGQFLDNFEFAADHPARATPGVYHSWIGGPPGKRLQVILLDTRYFRSPIKVERINNRKTIVPNTNPGATILGGAQWKWLELELLKRADLRLIVSSIQVITTEHRFEKWSNIPGDRKRLIALLKKCATKRVVLLSGDRHLAEIAVMTRKESGLPYDLVDFTSSGMTHAGASVGPNRHRVGPCWTKNNFGTIDIDWSGNIPVPSLTIRDQDGKAIYRHPVTFPH
jgi:alkaline phosphatase D